MSFEIGRVRIAGLAVPCARGADGVVRDARELASDWIGPTLDPCFLSHIENRVPGLPELYGDRLANLPFGGGSHLVCVGQNFADHAAELSTTEQREDPLCYLKPYYTLSVSGAIAIPDGCCTVSWEGELAVVIGRSAHQLPDEESSLAVISGYTTSNDLGDYDWTLNRGGQWVKGKAFPDFNPIGTWIRVGRDCHPPQDSFLTTRVNGAIVQRAPLSSMLHAPQYLVWYISQFFCLEPGDVINCGTPGGTALAAGQFLQVGDLVDVSVSGLNTLRTRLT